MIRVERRGKKVAESSSVLDGLFRGLASILLADLKSAVRQGVASAVSRLTSGLIAAALLVTAAVFLLVAGVEALRHATLPAWSAYLIVAVAGLTAGWLILPRR